MRERAGILDRKSPRNKGPSSNASISDFFVIVGFLQDNMFFGSLVDVLRTCAMALDRKQ